MGFFFILVGFSGRPRGAEGGGGSSIRSTCPASVPRRGPGGSGARLPPPCAAARHQLRARKDGRSPALCRELKMEDAAARESGAGESPAQRKRAFSFSAAASCDPVVCPAPSWHLRFFSRPFERGSLWLGEGT